MLHGMGGSSMFLRMGDVIMSHGIGDIIMFHGMGGYSSVLWNDIVLAVADKVVLVSFW